jgi:hypothetical protein
MKRLNRENAAVPADAGGPAEPGGAGANDGGVAGPLAGVAGVPARLDQSRVCGARARLPRPVPRLHPAGGTDGAAGRPEAVRRTLALLESRLTGLGVTPGAQRRQAASLLGAAGSGPGQPVGSADQRAAGLPRLVK